MSSIAPDFRFTNLGAAPGVTAPLTSAATANSEKKTWGENFFKRLSAKKLMGAIGLGSNLNSPTRHS